MFSNDYEEALECQMNENLGSLKCVEFVMKGCGTLHVDLGQHTDYGTLVPLEDSGIDVLEGPGQKKWCVSEDSNDSNDFSNYSW